MSSVVPAIESEPDSRDVERRLVARVRAGDSRAWGELYDLHAASLYRRVLVPRLGDRTAAEDALSETFRTAIEKFDRYQEREVSFYFWLSRIAHNKAMDMHRARAMSGRKIADLRVMLEPLSSLTEGADDLLELAVSGREMEGLVSETLSALNPRSRRAIELRFFEEKGREECAAALEVKLGTFDVVLLRALRSFRERWENLIRARKEEAHDGTVRAALAGG